MELNESDFNPETEQGRVQKQNKVNFVSDVVGLNINTFKH